MKSILQLVLVACIILTVAGAAVLLFRASSSGDMEVILPMPTAEAALDLRVHMKGAVRNPGVYSLNDGDRLEQAVEAAGGLTDDADLMAINLAQRVRDEDEWLIPRVGEGPVQATVRNPTDRATSDGGPAYGPAYAPPSGGKIDINSATAAQLQDGLPGIGEARAQAIVSYREANGSFTSVDELLEVHGIGPGTLDGIRGLIEVR